MGNRILKKLLDVDTQKENKTFYTRDAQGNVLSIYENGKQKKYRDGRDNIYYFNAQNELINYTDETGKNLFTFNIKGKLIFEEGKIFVCIVKIEHEYTNCNRIPQLVQASGLYLSNYKPVACLLRSNSLRVTNQSYTLALSNWFE